MSPDGVEIANKRQKPSNEDRPAVDVADTYQAQDQDETSSSGTSSSEIDEASDDDGEQDLSIQGDDDDVDHDHGDASESESPRVEAFEGQASEGTNDLQTRLKAFLPRLQKANDELQDPEIARDQRLDHVSDDEENYIEMNLNLGVLEEQSPGREEDDDIKFATSSISDSPDEEASRENGLEDGVMAHLMGEQESSHKKRRIEELG